MTTASSAGAVIDQTAAKVDVVNALGTSPQNEATTGNDADVTIDCAGGQAATIPVVDPGGDASAGAHTFMIPGTNTCQVTAASFSDTPKSAGGSFHQDFDCSSPGGGPNQFNFAAGHVYKVVIEPVYGTLPLAEGTIASTLPLALNDCEIRMYEDPVQPLGFGNAQFTMRQAACLTGRNFHIISVMLSGNEIMSGIDPCSQKTAEIAQGVYDVTLTVKLDANGDGDFGDKWTVFAPNPNGCDDSTLGVALTSFSPDGCPTIDETATVNVDLGNISFAPGEHFAFNFVDNGSGQFIPMVYGGGDFQDPIPTANWGPGATCDNRRVPTGAPPPNTNAPVVVAGFGFGAPSTTAYECVGTPDNPFGGLGVIAGASTVQVNFDGNDIPRDPGLDTFCTTLITQFQSTVKAETDYIATLTVKDEVDTHLGLLVYNTNQVINTLLKFAPPDILPAIQTLTGGLIQLNQGLQATNYNTGTLGQENLDKIQDGLANPPADPARDAAVAELTAWVPANCFPASGGGEATPATPVNAAARFTG